MRLSSLQRSARWCVWFVACVVCLPGVLPAQKPAAPAAETAPARKPLYIFHLASIKRALTNTGKMFEAAERPDMIEVIANFMASSMGDLGGVDKERPIGQMAFLDSTVLPPQPRFISYVPVTDYAQFFSTLELTGGKPKQLSDTEFEIDFGGTKATARLQHNYIWMAPPGQELPTFELPDPKELTADLAARYDMAIALPVSNVPPGIRTLFATMLRSQGAANLQQRDEEPDYVFEARKAEGEALVELASMILTDGKDLTFGLDVTEDGRRAAIEIQLIANSDSQFAGYLSKITGKATSFAPLLDSRDPLRVSMSWNAGKLEKQLFKGLIGRARNAVMEAIPGVGANAAEKFATTLNATVDKGHIDGILKVLQAGESNMAMFGAVKVVGAETLDRSLRDLMIHVGLALPLTYNVAMDVHKHDTVSMHRITRENGFTRGATARAWGTDTAIYFGVGNGAFWFAFGGQDALKHVDAAIDALGGGNAGTMRASNSPFDAVFHLQPWLNIAPGSSRNDQKSHELSKLATADGNDEIHLEVQPLDNGLRAKILVQDAFVKLIGLQLANVYDSFQGNARQGVQDSVE